MEVTTSSWICSTFAGVTRSEHLDVHRSNFALLLGMPYWRRTQERGVICYVLLEWHCFCKQLDFSNYDDHQLDVHGPYKTSISHRQAIAYLGSAGHP